MQGIISTDEGKLRQGRKLLLTLEWKTKRGDEVMEVRVS